LVTDFKYFRRIFKETFFNKREVKILAKVLEQAGEMHYLFSFIFKILLFNFNVISMFFGSSHIFWDQRRETSCSGAIGRVFRSLRVFKYWWKCS